MYVKPPTSNTSRVKLPDNYGGSVFSSSYYGDMPPPVRQPASQRSDDHSTDIPKHSDTPPKSSPLAKQMLEPRSDIVDQSFVDECSNEKYDDESDLQNFALQTHHHAEDVHAESKQEHKNPSLLSSLIPSFSPLKSFPFGHGIGGEELLILGVMLLIFLSGSESGEIDSEFIILLGMLLFAG